jgi:hypothetical protein
VPAPGNQTHLVISERSSHKSGQHPYTDEVGRQAVAVCEADMFTRTAHQNLFLILKSVPVTIVTDFEMKGLLFLSQLSRPIVGSDKLCDRAVSWKYLSEGNITLNRWQRQIV